MDGSAEKRQTNIIIYLSGSIRKGAEDTRSSDYFWSENDQSLIKARIRQSVKFLNPANTDIDRNDYYANFGCDLFLVSKSDIILVDLRKKKGIGIGAELMLADKLGIPVVGVLGIGSDYQKASLTNVAGQNLENWTHPFAFGLCDEIASSLEDACKIIDNADAKFGVRSLYKEKSNQSIIYFLEKYPNFKRGFDG